jgi:Fe2+ or Zn2+ uptake regulation protein
MPREDYAAELRAVNLRVTGSHLAVLELLERRPHLRAETVLHELRSRFSAVSHEKVFHLLTSLTEAGLVRRIEPDGQPALYERRTGDDHHHVVCRRCGRVDNVTGGADGDGPCLTLADSGPVLDESEVTWWGVCSDCAVPTTV